MGSICIFGDSITSGADDIEMGGWAARLKVYFFDKTSSRYTKVHQLGISGEFVEDVISRIDSEASPRNPEIIILAAGINDSRTLEDGSVAKTYEDFKKDLTLLIKKAKAHTSQVALVGLTLVDESQTQPYYFRGEKRDAYFTNERIQIFDKIIQQIAEQQSLFYIPMDDILTLDDISDGLHPNTVGHQKMFERVRDFLLENVLNTK